MRLIVKSPVWDDLREIGQRIATDNPAAADRFFAAAKDALELLTRHPGLGRLRSFSLPGVRSWVVPDFENYEARSKPTRKPREGTRPTGMRPTTPCLEARCPQRAGF